MGRGPVVIRGFQQISRRLKIETLTSEVEYKKKQPRGPPVDFLGLVLELMGRGNRVYKWC